MSSNDIRKYIKILNESILKESYDQRVSQVIEILKRRAPVLIQDLSTSILSAARELDTVEFKMRSSGTVSGIRAWKEFEQDVSKLAKSEKLIKRVSTRAPYYVRGVHDDKIPIAHDDIAQLSNKMMQYAGEAFPDGDPNDMLSDYFRRKGWDTYDAYDKLVPVAAKKYLDVPDYNTYLANMWDDAYGDAKSDAEHGHPERVDMFGGMNATNPWR